MNAPRPTRPSIIAGLAAALVFATWSPTAGQVSAPSEAEVLTFDEALRQLKANNESIHAASLLVEQRRTDREAAKSVFWPTVTLSGAAVTLSTAIEQRIPLDALAALLPVPLPAGSVSLELQSQRFAVASLHARWLLYSGGKAQAANTAAVARVEEAEAAGRHTANVLSTALVRVYFGAQVRKRAREVRAAALRALDRLSFDARRLEAEGIIARAERLAAEVAHADGARLLAAAGSDEALARIALANLLARDTAGAPTTPLFVNEQIAPVEEFVAAMRRTHPALRQVRASGAFADAAAAAARGGYRPDVFAFARQTVAEAGVSDLVPYGTYGVGVVWTLFDGPGRRQVAAAELQRQRAAAVLAGAVRDLTTRVHQTHGELTKARDEFHALDASVKLAEEHLNVRTRAFAEGMATTLEVVDAQVRLSTIRLARVSAAYACVVALAELLEASGQPERFDEYRRMGTEVSTS